MEPSFYLILLAARDILGSLTNLSLEESCFACEYKDVLIKT